MKEINLRKYYPHYTQDVMVSVPDEVAELLQEFVRAEDAQRIRTYRHKAMYSLELMNEIREIPSSSPLPEELLEQNCLNELLYKGLHSLPEKQRFRLIAYYFFGMSKAEIARSEGSSVNSVKESIQCALRSMAIFLKKISVRPRRFASKMYGIYRGTFSGVAKRRITTPETPSVSLANFDNRIYNVSNTSPPD